ncbi:MAG: LD-carboxypeptidase [Alphaproteobacteria bacterium]|nr:LD-carboxypeptidase [Alphaproteobacteria bacterium]
MSFLKAGDKIGIIAPSVGLKEKDLAPTLAFFKKLNLTPILASNLNSSYRYMAGTDKERALNINKMFEDSSIKALFCLRGGAGATRMLDYLDYEIIRNNLKPVVGLSDSTALQNALYAKTKNPSLTGFLPLYDLNDKTIAPQTEASLLSALFENNHLITSGTSLHEGTAEGVIIGGCLSVLLYLCGTPYFPDLSGKILLLEDIEEKTYKIDLMLNQLKQQKGFNALKGIIIGQFTDCPVVDPEDGTINDCIKDFTKNLNIPIITDFAYGHIPARHILPIGLTAKISATPETCTISW